MLLTDSYSLTFLPRQEIFKFCRRIYCRGEKKKRKTFFFYVNLPVTISFLILVSFYIHWQVLEYRIPDNSFQNLIYSVLLRCCSICLSLVFGLMMTMWNTCRSNAALSLLLSYVHIHTYLHTYMEDFIYIYKLHTCNMVHVQFYFFPILWIKSILVDLLGTVEDKPRLTLYAAEHSAVSLLSFRILTFIT